MKPIEFLKSQYLSASFKEKILPHLTNAKYVGEIATYVLPKNMSDEQIVSEYKIQEISVEYLGSFLQNYLETADKEGYNICYVRVGDISRVMSVRWSGCGWNVLDWSRDSGWGEGCRVFAPATGALNPSIKSYDPLTLESAIKICKENGLEVTRHY